MTEKHTTPPRYQIVLRRINGDRSEDVSMIGPQYDALTPLLGETLGHLIAEAVKTFEPSYYREVLTEAMKWTEWVRP